VSTERERRFPAPIRGQILFAAVFFLISALLLSLIGDQTRYAEGKQFFAQPRFWPAVALGGMVICGGLYLRALPRHRLAREDLREAGRWLGALEWALWFMAYVLAVPKLGYLPVSVAFAVAMTWRLGYRSARWLWTAAIFGVLVVVTFKGFLSVKIPGAALYELFPEAVRSLFILYF